MSTNAKRRANMKYREKAIIKQSVDLNKNTDRDIIRYLNSTGNKMGAIKKAIRSQMKSKSTVSKKQKSSSISANSKNKNSSQKQSRNSSQKKEKKSR